jgi:hypothetical protein
LPYEPEDRNWWLYWAAGNRRWHLYDMREPTAQVAELLVEIDADPTGIFWGEKARMARTKPGVPFPALDAHR